MITDVTNEVNFLRACVQLVDWFGTTMKVHLTDGSKFLNVCKVLGTVRPCAVRCIVLGWLNVQVECASSWLMVIVERNRCWYMVCDVNRSCECFVLEMLGQFSIEQDCPRAF
jgi:hypothetical protein